MSPAVYQHRAHSGLSGWQRPTFFGGITYLGSGALHTSGLLWLKVTSAERSAGLDNMDAFNCHLEITGKIETGNRTTNYFLHVGLSFVETTCFLRTH